MKNARSDLIDLALIIHHETKPDMQNEGAILVSDDGDRKRAVWLPKAACEIERRKDATIVTMPERLAIDKGLGTIPTRFTADDAHRAHKEWGANCGPGAIAAIMGMTLDEVRPHIPGFDAKRYTSPSMMNAALRSIGRPWKKIGAAWPAYGLVRIQWEGPWTMPGVPMVARYRHTHWVGAETARRGIGIFDINCVIPPTEINNGSGWIGLEDWSSTIVPWLLEGNTRASGAWRITHAIEVTP